MSVRQRPFGKDDLPKASDKPACTSDCKHTIFSIGQTVPMGGTDPLNPSRCPALLCTVGADEARKYSNPIQFVMKNVICWMCWTRQGRKTAYPLANVLIELGVEGLPAHSPVECCMVREERADSVQVLFDKPEKPQQRARRVASSAGPDEASSTIGSFDGVRQMLESYKTTIAARESRREAEARRAARKEEKRLKKLARQEEKRRQMQAEEAAMIERELERLEDPEYFFTRTVIPDPNCKLQPHERSVERNHRKRSAHGIVVPVDLGNGDTCYSHGEDGLFRPNRRFTVVTEYRPVAPVGKPIDEDLGHGAVTLGNGELYMEEDSRVVSSVADLLSLIAEAFEQRKSEGREIKVDGEAISAEDFIERVGAARLAMLWDRNFVLDQVELWLKVFEKWGYERSEVAALLTELIDEERDRVGGPFDEIAFLHEKVRNFERSFDDERPVQPVSAELPEA